MPQAFEYLVFRIGLAVISCTFYGAFLVLFIISLLIFRQQHEKNVATQVSRTNTYLVFSYLMLAVLTTVWVLSAAMFFNPELTEVENIRGYSSLMFAQHIVGYLASGIGDSVMVYRLYTISDQKRIILCCAIFLVLCGLGLTLAVVFFYALHQHNFLQPANTILAGMSISVNVTATSLIAWRVWERQALTRAVGGGEIITRLQAIFIESCALYTFWMIAFLVAHFANNPVSQVFLYGSPHVAGIASMLINVRVGLGWAVGKGGYFTCSLDDSVLANSRLSRGLSPTIP